MSTVFVQRGRIAMRYFLVSTLALTSVLPVVSGSTEAASAAVQGSTGLSDYAAFDAAGPVAVQAADFVLADGLSAVSAQINGVTDDVVRSVGIDSSFGSVSGLRDVIGMDGALVIASGSTPDLEENYSAVSYRDYTSDLSGTPSAALLGQMQSLELMDEVDLSYFSAYNYTDLQMQLTPTADYLVLNYSFVTSELSVTPDSIRDQAGIYAISSEVGGDWTNPLQCINSPATELGILGITLGAQDSTLDEVDAYSNAQAALMSLNAGALAGAPDPALVNPFATYADYDVNNSVDQLPPPGLMYHSTVGGKKLIWQVSNTCVIDVSVERGLGHDVILGLAVANYSDSDFPSALLIEANSVGFSSSALPIPLGMSTSAELGGGAGHGLTSNSVWVEGYTMVSRWDVTDFGAEVGVVDAVTYDYALDAAEAATAGVAIGARGTLVTFTGNVVPDGWNATTSFTYHPFGVQHAVNESRLTGWTQCLSFGFDEDYVDLTRYVAQNCGMASVLSLGRNESGAFINTLAATRAWYYSTDTTGNDTVYSNGTFWYFDTDNAVGFAGSAYVDLSGGNCDVSDIDIDRMCWNMDTGDALPLSGRIGGLSVSNAFPGVDVSSGPTNPYVRVLYSSPLESPQSDVALEVPTYDQSEPWCQPRTATNDTGEVFLGGDFLEVAVSRYGTFGTDEVTPDTFRGVDSLSGIGLAHDLDGYCNGIDLPLDYAGADDMDRWSLGFLDGDQQRWISAAVAYGNSYYASDGGLSIETEPVLNLSLEDHLVARATVYIVDQGERIFRLAITHSFRTDSHAVRTMYELESLVDAEFDDVRLMRATPSEALNSLMGQRYFERAQTASIFGQGDSLPLAAIDLRYDANFPLLNAFYKNDVFTELPMVLFSEGTDAYVSFVNYIQDLDPFNLDEGNLDQVNFPQRVATIEDCYWCDIQLTFDIGFMERFYQDNPRVVVTSLIDNSFDNQANQLLEIQYDHPRYFLADRPASADLYDTVLSEIGASALGATNLMINGYTAAEFETGVAQADSGTYFGQSFATFDEADRLIEIPTGLMFTPGYGAEAYSYLTAGSATAEVVSPESENYFGDNAIVPFDDQESSGPVLRHLAALSEDKNVLQGGPASSALDPLEITFDIPVLDDYLKVDFVFASTEYGANHLDMIRWSVFEYVDSLGIYVKGSEQEWADATSCAFPTADSVMNLPNAGFVDPGEFDAVREQARSNYIDLVAPTSLDGYQQIPDTYVATFADDQPADNEVQTPNIAYVTEGRGAVVNFATTKVTCSVNVGAMAAVGETVSVSIVASNVGDNSLPPVIFLGQDSLRFSSNAIAAPQAEEDAVIAGAVGLDPITVVTDTVSSAAPYGGPVITSTGISAPAGQVATLQGTNLGSVSSVEIDGKTVEVVATDNTIEFTVPANIPAGTYDLVVISSSGRLSLASVLVVTAAAPTRADDGVIGSVKRIGDTTRIFATNIVGAGKVQLFVNGREIAWVRAVDETDPKLRYANNTYYLVRRVELAEGKNVIEIYVDGVRIRRVAYTK